MAGFANAFELLSLHEETDASTVAKLQSKRAQKRLRRQAQLREVGIPDHGSHPATAEPGPGMPHHGTALQQDGLAWEGEYIAMSDELFNQWLMTHTALPTISTAPLPPSPSPLQPPSPITPSWISKAREVEHLPDPSTPSYSNPPTLRPTRTKHPPTLQCSPPSPTPPPEEAFPPLNLTNPAPQTPHSHPSLRLPLRAPHPRKPAAAPNNVKVLRAGKERAAIDDYEADLQRISGLDLEWDLRLEGMVPKAITLPDHVSNLDADAECKEQVRTQLVRQASLEEEGPSDRNCDVDTLRHMMAKAANKHRQNSGGWPSEDAGGTIGDSYGPGAEDGNPYWSKTSGKEWRQQIEAMMARGWEPLAQGRSKHIKWRRELLDGSVQTLTMPCTPSDSICGIRNFQADLARKDRAAQEVLERVLRGAAAL